MKFLKKILKQENYTMKKINNPNYTNLFSNQKSKINDFNQI